ncbi:GNAT family acetyltransferase [Leucobacter massiliensis]|uniref:GNAT family acetyltransferase n=1 Tax=Leucobacter massiliensis TaxID=1686285 RepID=A0A2S9QPY4_9MICO|nr:GNAT family acetyltransferase [Leucobacter massiliensis]PRI11646.1 GNAT family acetyltransferase [Leucobacter massiliensis]
MRIRAFVPADTEAVVALWEEAGLTRPWNDPHRDIARKATVQPELFLVAEDAEGRIVGSVMAGYEGHRGWMNYLAAAQDARGLGIGRALVERVERELHARGCPKVSLQVRSGNARVIDFYEHLGYAVDDVVSLGKRLIPDLPADAAAGNARR